jgi:hypothetical protein
MHRRILIAAAGAAIAVTATSGALAASAPHRAAHRHASKGANVTRLNLTPSTPELAACMPNARVKLAVKSTVDKLGFDTLTVRARHLAPKRDYTIFFLETAGPPFGAAEYIGDISTNKHGNAYNKFNLIVDEAFSSTVVDGKRVRVDLNQVGMWFADPADDDFCIGDTGQVTPFDGDNEAGVQAFNSANTRPLPAP